MKSIIILFVCIIACFAMENNNVQGSVTVLRSSELSIPTSNDSCSICYTFVTDVYSSIVAVISGGYGYGCDKLCAGLSTSNEILVCEAICGAVGVEFFVEIFNVTDPDPIYMCQQFSLCPIVTTGAVQMLNVTTSPISGKVGTLFNIYMLYNVTSATGPGFLNFLMIAPDSSTLGDALFNTGIAVGEYELDWELQATPSEQEEFVQGLYKVYVSICEGDCTTAHPNGGVYAAGQAHFSIV